MSKLSRDIRATVKAGTSIPAKVIDIHFGKAAVRLLSNGHVIHGLDVVGGPVAVGQRVRVDFTTSKPTVVVTGQNDTTQQQINQTLATKDVQGSPKNTNPPAILDPEVPAVSGGHVIQWEGEDQPEEPDLNFTGGVEVTDDSGNTATVVKVIGHTVLDETTPMAGRSKLAFIGVGVELEDDEAGDKTKVLITSGSGRHTITSGSLHMPGRTYLDFPDAELEDDEAEDTTRVSISGLISVYHNGSYIGATGGLNFIDG